MAGPGWVGRSEGRCHHAAGWAAARTWHTTGVLRGTSARAGWHDHIEACALYCKHSQGMGQGAWR